MNNDQIELYLKQFSNFEEFNSDFDDFVLLNNFVDVEQLLDHINATNYFREQIDIYGLGMHAALLDGLKTNKYYFERLNLLFIEEIKIVNDEDVTGNKSLNDKLTNFDILTLSNLLEFWKNKKFDLETQINNNNNLDIVMEGEGLVGMNQLLKIMQLKIDRYSDLIKDFQKSVEIIKKHYGEQADKLILLHEFGIIEYLRQILIKNKLKGKLESLIGF